MCNIGLQSRPLQIVVTRSETLPTNTALVSSECSNPNKSKNAKLQKMLQFTGVDVQQRQEKNEAHHLHHGSHAWEVSNNCLLCPLAAGMLGTHEVV